MSVRMVVSEASSEQDGPSLTLRVAARAASHRLAESTVPVTRASCCPNAARVAQCPARFSRALLELR